MKFLRVKFRSSCKERREEHPQFEDDGLQRTLLLNGAIAARQLSRGSAIASLADAEFRVFSQWGEDGIIEWLAAHVPVSRQVFVEFGVESFREANCRFLMMHRNWRGLVMDGDERNMEALRAQNFFWKHDLTAVQAFVTAENIDDLLVRGGIAGPIGILSIDIDGNDYWVWKKITAVDPDIVVCECNPILGDTAPIVIPYDPAFTRFKGHHSGLYFGASVRALQLLAEERGYEFLGTTSTGINAFFVRKALASHVRPLLRTVRAWPALHRDSRDQEGRLSYVRGLQRLDLIRELPVIDVERNVQVRLRDIANPYSADWRAAIE
jgi:hypothetical protein